MAPACPEASSPPDVALVAALLPFGEGGWLYYVLCALFFTICGIACGYFIWRKGHMQMLDAESEVTRAAGELEDLRSDLGREEEILREDGVGEEIDHVLAATTEREAEARDR